MSTTQHTRTVDRQPVADPTRRAATIVGWLFIVTYVTSISAKIGFYPPLFDGNYVTGPGEDSRVLWGAFAECILIIANIGTAVVLFPVLRRWSESLSLSYVASRVLESTVIVVGIVSVLAVVTMRQDVAGASNADTASLLAASSSLVAIHDATFLLGPAFCAGFGTGILLGYMMFRSGLVPRRLAAIGLVGGPLAFASATAVLFGVYDQVSPWSFAMTFPEMVWEMSLGIWLIAKGFSASPVAASSPVIATYQPASAD